jgi:RNA polymerase sigma factor for flagellar operon FliA
MSDNQVVSFDTRNSRIDPEELKQLWERYKETGDIETKNRILLNYGYLVKWIVRRMMPKYNNYNEYDDLVSCGTIGLIDAVDKFDLSQGVKFDTYAVPRIRGEILDYMRSQDWAPPSLRKKINAISRAYETYENTHPGEPDDKAVADSLNMPVEQVQKILTQTHMFNLVNFEDALSNSPNPEAELRAPDDITPEEELIKKEQKELLVELIDGLPEKERMVITLYYYEGFLLKDIAEMMQVTESRVSQIHSKVLMKMRAKLSDA